LDNFLTATCSHLNNPTGAATTSTVATGIACTPIDPASKGTAQAYPVEKLFLLRESHTKYSGFATGDFLVSGGVTYAVVGVGEWAAQGGMDKYYSLTLEISLGS